VQPASRCCWTIATRDPGVKFADVELLGIPHRIVIGERGLEAGKLEYRHRRATENEDVAADGVLDFLRARIAH
jgi:prolyl-tRNA synthetase